MAELYDWYKTTLEFLKGNKVLLLIVTAFLGIGGNIYQAVKTPAAKEKPKKVTQKTIVNKCQCDLNSHIKEHHK